MYVHGCDQEGEKKEGGVFVYTFGLTVRLLGTIGYFVTKEMRLIFSLDMTVSLQVYLN